MPSKMPDRRGAVTGGALCGDSMNRLSRWLLLLDKEIGVPAQRIAMRRIREVLRLKQECELSYGQSAQALRISKGTVANYLSLAEAAGISHNLALGLDDATLLARLYPKRYVYRQFALPDFAQAHRELKRKGVTLQLLWEEYREAAQGVAYSRSRFYDERYVAFVGTLKRSMRQTHVAGEKLFVDFAGPTVPIYEAASGQESRAHIFVAVWGASNYTYVEATAVETIDDWICAHVNALTFFGGCPALSVPDQPRALISKPERYEPQSNRTYEALAEHYGCAILPARPGKPRDKRRVRWITPEQVQKLLALLPDHQRELVTFALATGLRHGNVMGLEWAQVDLERKVAWLYGDQAKGGRDIHVSMNETALGVFRRHVGKHPERVFVFRDKPIAAANTRAWREALKNADIVDVRWHDLRHTWASWLAQSGVPMAVIQEMGAWKSPEMVRRYAHLTPAVLADHAKVIDTKMAQPDVCGGETVPTS